MSDLKGLIRYHKWRLDEKRRALADLHSLVDRLREQLQALEAEIVSEQQTARNSPDVAYSYARYAAVAIYRRKTLTESIAQVEYQIDVATEEMREMFQEVKRYELAQEERTRREKEKIKKREAAMLDEIALGGFQRRQQQTKQGEQGTP